MSRVKPETSMPEELRERLEGLAAAYKAVRAKEEHIRKRLEARIAPLRIAMGEFIDKYNGRLAHLKQKKSDINSAFLALWSEHLPGLRSIVLSLGQVRKRREIKVEILDKQKVIDALDRLDRLDLVNEVVDEKGLHKLVREVEADAFPEGALEVSEVRRIQVYARKDV